MSWQLKQAVAKANKEEKDAQTKKRKDRQKELRDNEKMLKAKMTKTKTQTSKQTKEKKEQDTKVKIERAQPKIEKVEKESDAESSESDSSSSSTSGPAYHKNDIVLIRPPDDSKELMWLGQVASIKTANDGQHQYAIVWLEPTEDSDVANIEQIENWKFQLRTQKGTRIDKLDWLDGDQIQVKISTKKAKRTRDKPDRYMLSNTKSGVERAKEYINWWPKAENQKDGSSD